MLLKRILILAAFVLLFLVVFIGYSQYAHAVMEGKFRAERKKFGVEATTLTSTAPASPAPAPVANPSFETNALIGPVPPAPSDTNAAPVDTNTPAPATTPDATPSAPAATPDAAPSAPAVAPSTMNESGPASVFQLASYRPFAGTEVRLVSAEEGQAEVPAPAAAPETAPAPTPAPAAAKSAESSTGSVIVLLYHQFKPAGVKIPPAFQWTMHDDVFESEMKYIHDNGYNVIPMSQLLAFLRHEGTVPPKAVVITIDDGYKSAVVYAAPILKKYGYPWTFFIYPEFVTVAEGSGAVSWNDLLALQKEGIDIESHSMTHPNLKSHHQKIKGVWHNLSPDEYAAWLKNETAGSKAVLEEHMGKKIICLAYPYGEYNKEVEQAAIDAGYEAIFTVADNPVHATTSLHSIGRYTMTTPVEKNFAAYLRQGALGLTSAEPAPGATTSDPRPVITAVLGYSGTLDPKSIETSIRDMGIVHHDFDPATNTIRMYLPRPLVASVVLVNIRVEDASSHHVMVANWHFNYEPASGAAATHAPIAEPAAPVATNVPAATEFEKSVPEPVAPVVPQTAAH